MKKLFFLLLFVIPLYTNDLVEDRQCFSAAKRIREILYLLIEKAQEEGYITSLSHDSETLSEPDYLRNQTQRGLFLEECYGVPAILWTPWGRIRLVGHIDGTWTFIRHELYKHLNLAVHKHVFYSTSLKRTIGPVYAIRSIHNENLPEPCVKNRNDYTSLEFLQQVWHAVSSTG